MIPFPFQSGGLGRLGVPAIGTPGDPYFANVVALLHLDGADASTTLTEQTGKTFTAAGGCELDTAQVKYGTASCLFNGTSGRASSADSADWAFGSGDFTLECWVRWNALPNNGSTEMLISQYRIGTSASRSFFLGVNNVAGTYNFRAVISYDGTTALNAINTAIAISAGTWYHFALCRNGTAIRGFLDGVQVGSDYNVSTNSLHDSTTTLLLGASNDSGNTENHFNGWLDDARITKGVGRYTTGFTPPTAAFPNS